MNDGDELIPTRQSLLSRLKDWNDRESWKDFFDTYWKLIYLAATKAGLTDPEAQDVVQETVISVCKSIRGFKYRTEASSFKSWLLQLTKWRIIDEMRRRGRVKEPLRMTRPNASSETATVERIPDPHGLALEAIWDQEWDRNLMDAAIERVKRRVEAKQYQLFDLNVLKKWPVRKVAATLQVNAAQVYLAKHRVSALIRREIQYLEKRFV